jgi:C4-type Zn-finger protein
MTGNYTCEICNKHEAAFISPYEDMVYDYMLACERCWYESYLIKALQRDSMVRIDSVAGQDAVKNRLLVSLTYGLTQHNRSRDPYEDFRIVSR